MGGGAVWERVWRCRADDADSIRRSAARPTAAVSPPGSPAPQATRHQKRRAASWPVQRAEIALLGGPSSRRSPAARSSQAQTARSFAFQRPTLGMPVASLAHADAVRPVLLMW